MIGPILRWFLGDPSGACERDHMTPPARGSVRVTVQSSDLTYSYVREVDDSVENVDRIARACGSVLEAGAGVEVEETVVELRDSRTLDEFGMPKVVDRAVIDRNVIGRPVNIRCESDAFVRSEIGRLALIEHAARAFSRGCSVERERKHDMACDSWLPTISTALDVKLWRDLEVALSCPAGWKPEMRARMDVIARTVDLARPSNTEFKP